MSAIVSFIALLGVYYVNYLGSTGTVLGTNIGALGQIFPFPYMPAGLFFMIAWTLIFVLLGIFSIIMLVRYFSGKKNHNRILGLFTISSFFNIIRVIVTAREMYALSVLIIACLMIILMMILNRYKGHDMKNTFGQRVFGAYYGWISMATTVLSLSILVYLYNPAFAVTTTRTYIVLAIGVLVTLFSRLRRKNIAALVLALWALVGAVLAFVG